MNTSIAYKLYGIIYRVYHILQSAEKLFLRHTSPFEKQALKSLSYKTTDFLNHPIRLIQASKSLIGLNLDTPNEKLLKFNSSILTNNFYKSIKLYNTNPNL